MAKIFPRTSGADTVSVAERMFLNAVIENLDDNFCVFHSVPWVRVSSRKLQEGECDFLILHPELGIISIEVKPGDVFYDGPTGQWMRSDGSSLGKDPFLQARRSAHAISGLLTERVSGWSESGLASSHAVYFSGASRIQGRLPLHALPLLTLMEADLRQLQHCIENIAGHFREKPLRPQHDLIKRAIEQLRPEFQLIQAFNTKLQMEEQILHRMTEQQMEIMDMMQATPRLLIRGCAGSGKTLMALEKAIRLAREGQQVLLLCFNIPLAEWLRARIAMSEVSVEVAHFHGLCESMAKVAGLEFVVPDEPVARSAFFNHESPAMLDKAISMGLGPRYDAVIVDEGQDFAADWWLSIEELLRNPREGTMYVFHDPDQNIFDREFGFLLREATLTLDKNCRNTSQIAQYVNRLIRRPSRTMALTSDGMEPVEKRVSSADAEVEAVHRIVEQLTKKEGLDPNRILLLGRHRLSNSPFARISELAGLPLYDESKESGNCRGIRYATIYRFKGLEADCVILTGFRQPKPGITDPALYCAASRAKLLLYVLYRTDLPPSG